MGFGCMSSGAGNQPVELSEGLNQLKMEHPPLLKMLDDLLNLCNEIESNTTIEEQNKLRTKVEAFLSHLGPHSDREEGVLFEMMAEYIGKESGPLAVMEYEHNMAKSLIATFLSNTEDNQKEFSVEDINSNATLIKRAYYTLVDHFAKEENVLFPMAENILSDEEKAELARKIKLI